MGNAFRGYYAPTPEEMDSIWAKGLIILDTNALLNLFRYSETTRKEFMGVLQKQAEFLWIPFHVGSEFHSRRIDVINHQERAIDDVKKAIDDAIKTAEDSLKKLKDHPSLDIARVKAATKTGLADALEQVEAARDRHKKNVVENKTHEGTFDEITKLYNDRVGGPWTEAQLSALYAEGEVRFENLTPPGYEDRKKPAPDKYGDLVIWMQILEHASESKLPAIFVTDDGKEDWWYKVSGETIGPRPELVAEYWAQANQRVHFYSPQRFVEFAKERGAQVSDASVKEVGTVSTARRFSTDGANNISIWSAVHQSSKGKTNREASIRLLLQSHSLSIRNLERALVDAKDVDDERRIGELLKTALRQKRMLRLYLEKLKGDSSQDSSTYAWEELPKNWVHLQSNLNHFLPGIEDEMESGSFLDFIDRQNEEVEDSPISDDDPIDDD